MKVPLDASRSPLRPTLKIWIPRIGLHVVGNSNAGSRVLANSLLESKKDPRIVPHILLDGGGDMFGDEVSNQGVTLEDPQCRVFHGQDVNFDGTSYQTKDLNMPTSSVVMQRRYMGWVRLGTDSESNTQPHICLPPPFFEARKQKWICRFRLQDKHTSTCE